MKIFQRVAIDFKQRRILFDLPDDPEHDRPVIKVN